MRVTIEKSGDGLTLKIPESFAEESKLRQGSVVHLSVVDGNILLKPLSETEYTLEQLLAGVTDQNTHQENDFGNDDVLKILSTF
jgi:antitoxin MazE